ncbi:hypothetical protein ACQKWADRAFT_296222 [Trichoderma austrokoningii]
MKPRNAKSRIRRQSCCGHCCTTCVAIISPLLTCACITQRYAYVDLPLSLHVDQKLHFCTATGIRKLREFTTTWQRRVDFLWSLPCPLKPGQAGPIVVQILRRPAALARGDCGAFHREKGPCLRRNDQSSAAGQRFRPPIRPSGALCVECCGHSGGMNGPRYGHRSRFWIRGRSCRSLPLASMSQTGDESELVAWCGVVVFSSELAPREAQGCQRLTDCLALEDGEQLSNNT